MKLLAFIVFCMLHNQNGMLYTDDNIFIPEHEKKEIYLRGSVSFSPTPSPTVSHMGLSVSFSPTPSPTVSHIRS